MIERKGHPSIYFAAIFAVFLANAVPFLWLGEDSFVIIHDNLDSEISFLQVLKNSGALVPWNLREIEQVFNGLNAGYFATSGWLLRGLAAIMPVFPAYGVYSIIVRIIGFLGAFLLSKFFLRDSFDKNVFWALLLSGVWASMSCYTIYGISMLGLPLAVWAILNLSQKQKRVRNASVFVLCMYPFLSHFAFSGVFIPGLILLSAFTQLGNRAGLRLIFRALLLLLMCTIVAHFAMFYTYFFGEVTHRVERFYFHSGFDVLAALKRSFSALIFGQYHVGHVFNPSLLIAALVWIGRHPKQSSFLRYLSLGLLVCSLAFGFGLFLQQKLSSMVPLINVFQLSRVYQFVPILSLGIAIFFIQSNVPLKLKSLIILPFCLGTIMQNQELVQNWKAMISGNEVECSFREFYMIDAFQKADLIIGRSKEEFRVISLGIHPAVAQFNGFYTLDSYQNLYPLAYKHRWGEIIKDELEKDSKLEDYFNHWGNRCYAFSAELGMPSTYAEKNWRSQVVENWGVDFEKLYSGGCRFIFSKAEISLDNHPELFLVDEIPSSKSVLFVYGIHASVSND